MRVNGAVPEWLSETFYQFHVGPLKRFRLFGAAYSPAPTRAVRPPTCGSGLPEHGYRHGFGTGPAT